MKKLEMNQMENLQGGMDACHVAAGVGIVMACFGQPWGLFATMAFCLKGDK